MKTLEDLSVVGRQGEIKREIMVDRYMLASIFTTNFMHIAGVWLAKR